MIVSVDSAVCEAGVCKLGLGVFLKNLGFADPLSIACLSRVALSNAYKVMLIQAKLAKHCLFQAKLVGREKY